MPQIHVGGRRIALDEPTYFVADISANHDGELSRAIELVHLCAEAGADAAKFQNFAAESIVSDRGFRDLGGQMSHQAKWDKSVFEVYKSASIPWEWTPELKKACDEAGIEYFSAPYDMGAVDMLDEYVKMYKVGSGEITWPAILRAMASKGKPVLLATGASDIGEVQRAVDIVSESCHEICLMQCNTNYTGSLENFRFINLNVLKTYALMFPECVLGLSDHTPGHSTVLGAVALGARVVEKHFTDDTSRTGPDHPFSMDPVGWREMVDRTRELAAALGSTRKFVAGNETDTVVVQRRAVRARGDLPAGTVLTAEHLIVLRPAPVDGIFPYEMDAVIGKTLRCDIAAGQHLSWTQLG
jgi:sialic acid synthase SpsE